MLVKGPYLSDFGEPKRGRKPGVPTPMTPDGVPAYVARMAPKKLRHTHGFIIHLAALGMKNSEIAARTGFTQSRLSIILNAPRVQALIQKLRLELFERDPDQEMRLMLPQAMTVIREVLEDHNEKGSVKADVAFRLMDRTHGKPKQSIEVGGSLIKDLFEQMDKQAGRQTVASMLETSGTRVDDAEWSDILKEFSDGETGRDGDVRESIGEASRDSEGTAYGSEVPYDDGAESGEIPGPSPTHHAKLEPEKSSAEGEAAPEKPDPQVGNEQ